MRIRLAKSEDCSAIAAIYAPIVSDTTISFEWTPPSQSEMARRISETLLNYPWLVCEVGGQVTAFAYATMHRSRTAYQWSCEVSAYVSPGFSRQGQARQLYTALFTLLRRQNLVMAYAGITQPNEPSVGFHESMGFEHVGTYKNVGYKHGTWRDVSWWGKQLQTPVIPHDDPIKFSDLPSELKIPN